MTRGELISASTTAAKRGDPVAKAVIELANAVAELELSTVTFQIDQIRQAAILVEEQRKVRELERERAEMLGVLQSMVGPAGYLAQPAVARMLPLLNGWPVKARALVTRLTASAGKEPTP